MKNDHKSKKGTRAFFPIERNHFPPEEIINDFRQFSCIIIRVMFHNGIDFGENRSESIIKFLMTGAIKFLSEFRKRNAHTERLFFLIFTIFRFRRGLISG